MSGAASESDLVRVVLADANVLPSRVLRDYDNLELRLAIFRTRSDQSRGAQWTMASDHDSTNVARNALSQEVQLMIRNRAVLQRHRAGNVLLRQGEAGDRVLLVQAGRATVVASNDNGKQLLVAVLGPGSLLGEWAVLDGSDRAATATALDHGTAYVVPAAAFRYLYRTPAIADEITRYSIRQLRASN